MRDWMLAPALSLALLLSTGCATDAPTEDTACGNGECSATESCDTCPNDCGACASCGDGACNGSETCSFCPEDCGACGGPSCGNGTCGDDEDCISCAADCGECAREPTCGDFLCSGDENCTDCPMDCGSCGDSTCRNGVQDAGEAGVDCGGPCIACDYPQGRSLKRGFSYNFCDWSFSEGKTDLDLLVATGRERGGATWYYNWGYDPAPCVADLPELRTTLEYVPMIWTLHEGGADCGDGGQCFGGGFTADEMIQRFPPQTRYLLGYNEPNFRYQARLTPTQAAGGWNQLEVVADARGLQLIAPSPNYCDPRPDQDHGGSCTLEVEPRTFETAEYTVSVDVGHPYQLFEWLELFYDECSTSGSAQLACRFDFQAAHVYSYFGAAWIVELFKVKAGLKESGERHCGNNRQDEDEFGVDCGGNSCVACTAWAREQFSKPVWVTEFAPATDDVGPNVPTDQLAEDLRNYINSQIPIFENDPFVARYAWFMPKTDIGSLDHVDLINQTGPSGYTPAGEAYLNQPF